MIEIVPFIITSVLADHKHLSRRTEIRSAFEDLQNVD